MPRTYGESFVHVSEIDGFLCSWEPLPESKPPRIGRGRPRQSASTLLNSVRDGDCLQLGIGAVPDAVCSFLGDKKDLGLHTEMISDGVLPLLEKGVINGKRKQRDVGKRVRDLPDGQRASCMILSITTQLFNMLPVDVCNNPAIISENDNVVSINSCVRGRPAGSGLCRGDWPAADFRYWRSDGLCARRKLVQGRPFHHRAALHHQGRVGIQDCYNHHRPAVRLPPAAVTSITS